MTRTSDEVTTDDERAGVGNGSVSGSSGASKTRKGVDTAMADHLTPTMSSITQGSCRILLADYGHLGSKELADAVAENQRYIVELGEKGERDLLILTDVTHAEVDQVAISAFMDVARAMKPYTRASAVVGVGKARGIMLKVVNTFSALNNEPFASVDEAKQWLVGQSRSGKS